MAGETGDGRARTHVGRLVPSLRQASRGMSDGGCGGVLLALASAALMSCSATT